MRKRFQVKRGIVGSSDMRRVKSNRAELEMNHKRFISSELYAANASANAESSSRDNEPLPTQKVQVYICDKWITMEYAVVKAAGFTNWRL